MVIVGTAARLECSLIVERVRAGVRCAHLEGRHIGRGWNWTVLPSSKTAILSGQRPVARFWVVPRLDGSPVLQRRYCNSGRNCAARATIVNELSLRPEPLAASLMGPLCFEVRITTSARP